MSMISHNLPEHRPAEPTSTDAIAHALDKHKQVAEDIKEAAEELSVVHAVLETQLPGNVHMEDVGAAVARTDALEKRLNASAKVLEDANEEIEQEVKALKSGHSS